MIELKDIPIKDIKILENLRTSLNNISELMQSIKQHGLLEPIGVWQEGKQYILVYGSRRLNACKKLGWTTISALVSDESLAAEQFLISNTIENIQRKDIDTLELGKICWRLKNDMNMSIDEISVRLSIAKSTVELALSIFSNTPEKYRKRIGFRKQTIKDSNAIAASTAKMLIDARIIKEDREELFKIVEKENYSMSKVHLLIQAVKQGISVEKAQEQLGQLKTIHVELVVNKNVLNKLIESYKIYPTELIRQILLDKIPIQKNLLVK